MHKIPHKNVFSGGKKSVYESSGRSGPETYPGFS